MSTIPRRFIILLSAATAFAVDQAPADGITPISQSRSILILADAFACNEKSQFDGESATDFRPFDASLAIENTCKDIGAIAMASQQSTISETLLTATAGTWAETIVDDFVFVLAFSGSMYEVEFEVNAPVRIRIDGELSASAEAVQIPSFWVISSVTLQHEFDVLFEEMLIPELNAGPVESSVSHTMILAAGTYTYRARADANITDAFPTTGVMQASHDVTLEVFNIADLNFDHAVNAEDLAIMLGNWGQCAEQCIADLNGDAIVGPTDLALLLGNWG